MSAGLRALAAIAACLAISAQAEVIATAPRGKGWIELHEEFGPCFGGDARLAVYADGVQRIPGCWTRRINVIAIVLLDGDYIVLPVSAWKGPDVVNWRDR